MDSIFEKVKSLNFPIGKYVVIAGAAMEGYGIRKSGDIDILVTDDIYNKLKDEKRWSEIQKPSGLLCVQKDGFEISNKTGYGKYKPDPIKLIKNAKIINGVPFVEIQEIIAFKKALGREKDKKDLKLINDYLSGISGVNS